MRIIGKSPREITHEEFSNLKPGDSVFVKIGYNFYKSEVVSPAFYNSDSDEPCWEIETTNGFCDEYSLYTYV